MGALNNRSSLHIKKRLQTLSNALLDPHPRVMNPEKIQRSRLLSTILLIQSLVVLLIIALVVHADSNDIYEPTVQGAMVMIGISIGMYILNRLGRTSISALGYLLSLVGLFIYIPFYSGESPAFLAFLMIPIIFIAIFFSLKQTTIASTGILVLIGILLSFMDSSQENLPYWNLRNMWYFLMLASVLLLTFMQHLGNLEEIRREGLKSLNKEIQTNEARIRALVENSPDMILEIDRAGQIIFVNKFTEMYLGKNVRDVLPDDQIAQALESIQKVFTSGEPQAIELQTIAPDGHASWDSIRIGPVKQGGEITSLTIIMTEITIQKQINAERETFIQELEIKNAELERFNYTVSHELKSPVVTIKSFLGSIANDLHDGKLERAQKDILRISNATDKMHDTLSGLLELSRIGRIANPPEEVDLVQLVHEALETVHGRIQSHNITVQIAPDLPVVRGDRVRLREVYENLIDNATKYFGDQPAPLIEIGVRKYGNEIILFVKDNGMGIDAQYHKRIFGLFDKLDATSEGTGIGLALIKRIIETHGGGVWVESEGLGKGSTFCFTIPDTRKQGN